MVVLLLIVLGFVAFHYRKKMNWKGFIKWGFRISLGSVAAIVGLAIIASMLGIHPSPSSALRATATPQPTTPTPSKRAVVTKADYDQIQTGMTYEQVVQIIGTEGNELSRSEIAGNVTVMYAWKNRNGSNMNAMFQNNGLVAMAPRLVSKAQFGLP